ncbi:hypothetical protein FB451DRAFT_1388408 [Mycena latifolia]|nr:hypothetical protein FB451DRAFT_1388408 [Mycena latifolia]
MSSLAETISCFASTALPASRTYTDVVFAALAVAFTAAIIYYASPMRLTRVLVAAIEETEQTYLEAIESGALYTSDVEILRTAETIASLQTKVSRIQEASLRNSLSYRAVLCAFFKGRTLTVLQCIREVRGVQTHIEILKEEQLRNRDTPTKAGTVSLRRRSPDC